VTSAILITAGWVLIAVFVLALCQAGARGDRRERRYASDSSRALIAREPAGSTRPVPWREPQDLDDTSPWLSSTAARMSPPPPRAE
jgi:hypothetical protein